MTERSSDCRAFIVRRGVVPGALLRAGWLRQLPVCGLAVSVLPLPSLEPRGLKRSANARLL